MGGKSSVHECHPFAQTEVKPEVKLEPEIKQEPFTIRGYFGLDG